MTQFFPPETFIDRLLKRMGRPRAFRVEGGNANYGVFRATPEPLWRSLFRKKGAAPPDGWMYRPGE